MTEHEQRIEEFRAHVQAWFDQHGMERVFRYSDAEALYGEAA